MLVSVITVCYNSESTISKTIESVLNQTYNQIEYIIIDGRSQDKTLEIIECYMQDHPNRIRLVSEKDNGIYDAMNKGVKLAKGELVGIINSDDWYELNAIEAVIAYYKAEIPAVLHGFQRTYVNEREKNVIRTNSSQLSSTMIEHPTCFVSKALYASYGAFDPLYQYAADYELMLRFKKHDVPFVTMVEVIANFREGGASHTLKASLEVYKVWYNLNMISYKQYIFNLMGYRLRYYALKILGR